MKKANTLFLTAFLFFGMGCDGNGDPGDAATDTIPDTVTDDPTPDSAGMGSLSVISVPEGASVLLNMEAKGMTPALIEELAAGEYNLKVSMEGFQDYTQSVTINPDNVTDVGVTLTPDVSWNLNGRWAVVGESDICDVSQTGNIVRGFCYCPGAPLALAGSELYYHQDEPELTTIEGQVHDNDHVSLTITDTYGSQTFSHIRLP